MEPSSCCPITWVCITASLPTKRQSSTRVQIVHRGAGGWSGSATFRARAARESGAGRKSCGLTSRSSPVLNPAAPKETGKLFRFRGIASRFSGPDRAN